MDNAVQMLRLAFGKLEGPTRTIGVFSELRFDRACVRPSANGKPIAEHRNHAWQVAGERYLRLECEGRVMLHFSNAEGTLGQTFGPFEHVSSVDGVMTVNGRNFATFNEASGLWIIEPSGLQCPMLVARSLVP